MIYIPDTHAQKINSPVRRILAKVELLNSSSTNVNTFKYNDSLVSFSIDRVGEEGKFFGFGICQKINVKLRDVKRVLNITTDNYMKISVTALADTDENYIYPYPNFYVTESRRDENTNGLSITAYDALYGASKHIVSELELVAPYTVREFAAACASLLGLSFDVVGVSDTETCFDTSYSSGANFEGTETIRDALNAVAEATQTIYYINSNETLIFKRVDVNGLPALVIDKSRYFSLDSKTNRRLATICHVTELGDNVSASLAQNGSTQYIRDNPFWELRDDINILVDNALAVVGGLTINQFDCSWRGDYSLEIGDKISLVTKDTETLVNEDNEILVTESNETLVTESNEGIYSYLLNDTISYDGGLSEKTKWNYGDSEEEIVSNPTTIGEALKQTYARVDKVNKQIDLFATEIEENKEQTANLRINIDNVSVAVKQIENNTNDSLSLVNEDIQTLTSQVNAAMTAEEVRVEIQSELKNGVSKVETSTGFTFNEEGLSVSKSGSEMTTQITEDGMTVYRDSTPVLTANNSGVDAVNLHATTYLIVGNNSRFEDYGEDRTGCFWIGS